MAGNTLSNNPEQRLDPQSDIIIADQTLVPRLLAKRDEYSERLAQEEGALFEHPEKRLLTGTALDLLKMHALDAILAANRVAPGQPITKEQVVTYVADVTGYDLTSFLETPSKYEEEGMCWGPDIPAILANEGSDFTTPSASRFMAHAYWITRGYATGEMWGITGGTGLPEEPVASQS